MLISSKKNQKTLKISEKSEKNEKSVNNSFLRLQLLLSNKVNSQFEFPAHTVSTQRHNLKIKHVYSYPVTLLSYILRRKWFSKEFNLSSHLNDKCHLHWNSSVWNKNVWSYSLKKILPVRTIYLTSLSDARQNL